MKRWFLCLLLAWGCGQAPSARTQVLVSVAPYQTFVERLLEGEGVVVRSVAPGQVDPHAFEPTGRQMREMAGAQLWLQSGEPFERKMGRQFVGRMEVVAEDRHGWVSPKEALRTVEKMQEILCEEFPESAEVVHNHFVQIREELEALDWEVEALLGRVEAPVLLTSHPSFGAFCRDYGVEQVALEEEEGELRARQVGAALERVEGRARVAFVQPQHGRKGIVAAAERLGVPCVAIDPYDAQYEEMVRALAHHLVDGA